MVFWDDICHLRRPISVIYALYALPQPSLASRHFTFKLLLITSLIIYHMLHIYYFHYIYFSSAWLPGIIYWAFHFPAAAMLLYGSVWLLGFEDATLRFHYFCFYITIIYIYYFRFLFDLIDFDIQSRQPMLYYFDFISQASRKFQPRYHCHFPWCLMFTFLFSILFSEESLVFLSYRFPKYIHFFMNF